MKKLFAALVLLVLTSICLCAGAETLSVGNGGYESLTKAVAEAQDGDEIVMYTGVYDEKVETFPIVVDKQVTIRAAEGEAPVLKAPIMKITMKIKAPNVTVEGITIDFLRYGIWVLADNAAIKNCAVTLYDTAWREASCGVWLGGGKHMVLTDNVFTECGVAFAGPEQTAETHGVPVLTALFEVGEDIEYFTSHTIENNTVNGKPMNIVIGLHDTTYSEEAGQVIAVQCENVTFENMDLSNTSIGLQFYYCENVAAKNINADRGGVFGIYVAKSKDVTITDSQCNECSHGIDVRDATNTQITNVNADNCGQGIFFSWGHNSQVADCTMRDCGTGFFSAAGNGNHLHGSVVTGCELGMYIQHEPIFTVTDCQIANNTSCGTRVTDTGLISWDNLYENNFVAVMVLNSAVAQVGDCTFTGSQNRAVFAKNSQYIQLLGNQFDESDALLNEYIDTHAPVVTE